MVNGVNPISSDILYDQGRRQGSRSTTTKGYQVEISKQWTENINVAPYEPPFAVSISMWLHGVVCRKN